MRVLSELYSQNHTRSIQELNHTVSREFDPKGTDTLDGYSAIRVYIQGGWREPLVSDRVLFQANNNGISVSTLKAIGFAVKIQQASGYLPVMDKMGNSDHISTTIPLRG